MTKLRQSGVFAERANWGARFWPVLIGLANTPGFGLLFYYKVLENQPLGIRKNGPKI
jgi:hypothetical protein